ncbi:MAG TPA: UDP-glucose--hexose-1-phosphate uridylyltransferase [Polyangiaceae bacterium]|nr:UDP-glucose--hexose-1-phosphate uridylyltransferase [Polyangiaceae bacterium]
MSADSVPAGEAFDRARSSHRRLNPLTGDWVLVSPHRTDRPWLGQLEEEAAKDRATYDPGCTLCPGNRRVRGDCNPRYSSTFVFDNDFSALLPPPTPPSMASDPLFVTEAVAGVCRVVCFSPRHDLSLAEMDPASVGAVIDTLAMQTAELGARYPWVQVFENKGSAMGCSNPHPHGQIWASSFVPNEAAKEDARQRAYLERHGTSLLDDYARRELDAGERIVLANAHWVALVPFWATWPFETLIVPRRHVARLPDLEAPERATLAAFLHELLGRYDLLFDVSFPYSMGWHGAPFDAGSIAHWQLHAHVYPPLLRSATVRKHMVGYEMLALPQRDLTAEDAAGRLRRLAGLLGEATAAVNP